MKKLLPQFVALVVLVLIEVAVLREVLLAGYDFVYLDQENLQQQDLVRNLSVDFYTSR